MPLPYQPRAILPAPAQYLPQPQPQYYLQPRPQYLAGVASVPGAIQDQYYAPGAVAGRPISNLPSRQIEYVPTPIKQIDYTPPSISKRQLPYNGKISRRSDYDEFDDIAGVRPDAAAAAAAATGAEAAGDTTLIDGSTRSGGKFVFHTPGLDSSDQISGTRLEYAGDNSTRPQSATLSQAQFRQPDGQALTQQSAAASQYRVLSQAEGQALTQQSAAASQAGIQYRLITQPEAAALTQQSATNAGPTSSQAYRLITDNDQVASSGDLIDSNASAQQAGAEQGNPEQEYVEAVSEDGVHYHPVLPQPILTNVKLAKTLTQRSERTLSSLQYLLNNYNNNNNNTTSIHSLINNLNNNSSINNLGSNTFSIARTAATLSQQQQQQQDGQDTIEIPVQVPVKVRIPAPNPANKQQTYNTTIECRQKPYCADRDDNQILSN